MTEAKRGFFALIIDSGAALLIGLVLGVTLGWLGLRRR